MFGLETVCLRYFNVYGPRKLDTGSYPMVIPVFLGQRKKGEKLTVVGDGLQTRDYVHVKDVVEANILAWKSNLKNGEAINIGSGEQVSVNRIADLIDGDRVFVPARAGEMRFIQADITKAKELLCWAPKIKLEDGVAELKREWGIE